MIFPKLGIWLSKFPTIVGGFFSLKAVVPSITIVKHRQNIDILKQTYYFRMKAQLQEISVYLDTKIKFTNLSMFRILGRSRLVSTAVFSTSSSIRSS